MLLNQMNTTVDGAVPALRHRERRRTSATTSSGPTRACARWSPTSATTICVNLPRGGHDYRKLYAAYKAATENLGTGAPTVILCKTIKGWTLGPGFEGRNATHQIKKMTKEQLLDLRDRLYLHDEIPESALDGDDPPYYSGRQGLDRVPVHDGAPPGARRLDPQAHDRARAAARAARRRRRSPSCAPGRARQAVSTTMGFTRLLRNLCPRRDVRPRVVPIIPDEARTFGMDSLFRELKIYASQGQKYEPVDHDLLLSYAESTNGQILEEGITEAGSTASFIAAGTAYADPRRADGAVLHVLFDVRLPARRRPHLAGGRRPHARLPARRHRRSHDAARRGPAAPGRPLAGAAPHRAGRAGLRPGVRLRGRRDRAGGPAADVRRRRRADPDVFYYITLYNENYQMPAMPEHVAARPTRSSRPVPVARRPEGQRHAGDDCCSRVGAEGAAREAAAELAEHYDVGVELWSATSYKPLREDALAVERWNRLHPSQEPRTPRRRRAARRRRPARSSPSADFMKIVPEQIARFLPGRTFVPLGTDGMGRSDTREALRRFFEIDIGHVVVAVLAALAGAGRRRAGRRSTRRSPATTSTPTCPTPPTREIRPDARDAVHHR